MVLKDSLSSGSSPERGIDDTSGCSKNGAPEIGCRSCSLDPLCLLLGYGEDSAHLPDGILLRRRPVARGESIFRSGDPFHSVFAVKSGSFKTLMPGQSGHDQIIGFFLPGEIIGTVGFAEGVYPCTARALEASYICELRLDRLSESGNPTEVLQRAIIDLLGKEVAFNNSLLSSLIRQSAEQRIGAFLLNLSRRLDKRGKSCSEFTLGMSRGDIGSYLGLASETVSRVLTRFQKSGLLSLDKKQVSLLDPQGLTQLVEKS